VAPPIVDVTNGTTFVVNPDGNSGTSAVLEEVDTASLDVLATGLIGLGASGGTKLKIYQPAFSNDYYNDPSTGIVSVCGTGAADTTPWQYVFGFSGRTMNTPFSFSQQLLTSTAANVQVGPSSLIPMSAAARERISFLRPEPRLHCARRRNAVRVRCRDYRRHRAHD